MKLIVAIVGVGFLFLGFWLIRYQPKQNQILSLQTKIQQAKEEYQSLQVEANNLEKWKQAKREFESILLQFQQITSKGELIPSFLRNMENLVEEEKATTHDSSFEVTAITPGELKTAELNRGQNLPPAVSSAVFQGEKTPINLTFNGRFDTLVDFLRQLGNFKLKTVVIIKTIGLSPKSTEGGGSPILSITMPFEVYWSQRS